MAAAGFARENLRPADPAGAISFDHRQGTLSVDEKALLLVQAVKDPQALPAEYRIEDWHLQPGALRSATLALLEIRRDWDELNLQTKQRVSAALARPTGTYTYDSPGGFFKLHYHTSGGDAVSSIDADASGVPDYIEQCAAYCDSSLTKHRELGYRDPPSDEGVGGDERFDVYFESMPYYGYATWENPGPEPWNDYTSYLVLRNNYYGFPPNDDPEGNAAGAAKATAAHEFHHCVQFAYDIYDLLWFMELDAVYMEDIIFDHTNDNYNYLPLFMEEPEASLMENSTRMYACFIYGLYLAQKFDTSLMKAVWDGARYKTAFQALSDSLQGYYGWSQDSAFTEFTYWNYITNARDDGLHHEEASAYPLIEIAQMHSSYPVGPTSPPVFPSGYGVCYIQFRPMSLTGTLQINVDGDDSHQWGMYVIKSTSSTSHEHESIPLTPSTYEGMDHVPDFENDVTVTLAAVNLSEGSSSGSFDYMASVGTEFSVETEILTDSAVYAGKNRNYEYRVVNTSEEYYVLTISYWDDEGWLPVGSVDHYIGADETTLVEVDVSPPGGTPLGSRSDVHFRTELKSNGMAYQERSQTAVVVPRRGDVNYSGEISLADITYLISHVYLKGPDPQPWETGDFDCSGLITLADITQLISHVYMQGPHSPCDPF
jgi:hypothetical protein